MAEQDQAKEQALADKSTTDEELSAIPELLEGLRKQIVAQRAKLTPKLEETQERLVKLGPAPKDDAPKESDEIAAQRKHLENAVAEVDGKLKQADVLFVRAGQLIDEANDDAPRAIYRIAVPTST